MRRRDVITLLGSAAACRSRRVGSKARIGLLMPYLPTNAEMQARVRTFREESPPC